MILPNAVIIRNFNPLPIPIQRSRIKIYKTITAPTTRRMVDMSPLWAVSILAALLAAVEEALAEEEALAAEAEADADAFSAFCSAISSLALISR